MADVPLVDLRSDTVTRPTPGMREAMFRAEVGDDVLDGDPTTRMLEDRVAEILGKERALFFPSGIQANQTALAVHGRPGSEVILEAGAHIFNYEEGAGAALSGLQLRPVAAQEGLLSAELVREAIRPRSPYVHPTCLVALENTHNSAGGKILPLETFGEIRDVAEAAGVPIHLDGARLWHACAETGISPSRYGALADTVMVSLSKGLGAPVGSLLAGSAEAMERAWRIRRRLGGGMRQSGILAAAGLYALEFHMDRLAEDHGRARELARGAESVEGLGVPMPDTNIVMVDILADGVSPGKMLDRLSRAGVLMVQFGPRRLRAVTHLDVDDQGIARAVGALAQAMESFSGS
jgi:threonine aldolase